ncbi:MAG TPA: hypothetical protein IAC36_05225 [Candidatus Aphodomonas merdavium]|nr:hypothetical protein [Candidatus Aphodomonas merdavium]
MLEFIVSNLSIIICLAAGLGLLVVEMFVPGFGIPGISGIALLIASVVLMWLKAGALAAVGLVVIIMALAAILLSVSLKSAANGRLSRSRFILKDRESAEEGYTAASDMNIFVGCEGEARTVLRPSGIVEFDGVRLNVVSDGEFVAQGARVKVVRVDGNRIVVHSV